MNTHRALLWFSAIALLITSSWLTAGPAGYYRWIDSDGKPQFTQQPPKDRPSEFVQVSTGASSRVGPDAENAPDQPADGQPPAQTPPKDGTRTLQGVPDHDPEKCQQAQDTLSILTSKARIREKGSDGEYRFLNPDEIGEQKRLANEAVTIYCE